MVAVLSVIGVAPSALVLGGTFVSLVGLTDRVRPPVPVAAIYGAETLGSGAIGIVLGVYLFERLNPVAIVCLAGLTGLAAGTYLLLRDKAQRTPVKQIVPLACLACLIGTLALNERIDLLTRQVQWQPLEVAETLDSKYGNIVVTDRGGIHDFFETGVLAFTIPDRRYAEECVHIPLLHHPNPDDVLLIGGAGSGLVAEIGKHPSVGRIEYVEIDPAVISLVATYSPPGWLDSPGIDVTPVYGDGRHYVSKSSARFDVVIVSVGVPLSLQVNRYYTAEFFERVRSVLRPGGILSLKIQLEGAYLSPELASLLAALKNACRGSFEYVEVLPGDYIHLLASPELDIASRRDSLRAILRARHLATSYVTDGALQDRLSPFRMALLDSLVRQNDAGIANSDGQPVSFSYAISLWARHFRTGRLLYSVITWLDFEKCLLVLLLLCLAITLAHCLASRCSWSVLPAAITLYSMGFTAMFCQVLIVLGFQIVSGYIYARIAIIVAAFMLGMGAASSIAGWRQRGPARSRALAILHCGFIALPLTVLLALNHLKSPSTVLSYPADLVFAGLALLTGILGGSMFAAASSVMVARFQGRVDAGAIAYSLDLTGACVAGFATGLLIIPALGISQAAYVVSAANLVVLIVLIGLIALRPAPPPR
jgi:spermidine synthase